MHNENVLNPNYNRFTAFGKTEVILTLFQKAKQGWTWMENYQKSPVLYIKLRSQKNIPEVLPQFCQENYVDIVT